MKKDIALSVTEFVLGKVADRMDIEPDKHIVIANLVDNITDEDDGIRIENLTSITVATVKDVMDALCKDDQDTIKDGIDKGMGWIMFVDSMDRYSLVYYKEIIVTPSTGGMLN